MIFVRRSSDGVHKFVAVFPDGHRVRFGREGYSDYTLHKDPERMRRYLARHRAREDWSRSGARTPGFWSRWLLWSKPTLQQARVRTEKIVGQKVVFARKLTTS